MSKKQKPVAETHLISNGVTDFVNAMSASHFTQGGFHTGGSQLSSYETIAVSNNYSLITLNWPVLTFLYSSNGIIRTAIDLPIQDALSKGIEIESEELSADQTSQLLDHIEREGQWATLRRAWAWGRLYGGGALLLNTNQDPATPLIHNALHNAPLGFLDTDRWHLTSMDNIERNPNALYYLNGKTIHPSRVIPIRGADTTVYQRQILRGWGLSECEHTFSSLNSYIKTNRVIFELLDEYKINVYQIAGFSNAMKTSFESGKKIIQAFQLMNQTKHYNNAIILDANDKFETKHQSMAGVAEVLREIRVGVAADFRMTQTKLFGFPTTGFNSGESDLESYNQMVESSIREKMKPVIRKLIEYNMLHLWGRTSNFSLKFPSLRSLNSLDEQTVSDAKYNRAADAYEKGIITLSQMKEQLHSDKIFSCNLDSPSNDNSVSRNKEAKNLKFTQATEAFEQGLLSKEEWTQIMKSEGDFSDCLVKTISEKAPKKPFSLPSLLGKTKSKVKPQPKLEAKIKVITKGDQKPEINISK